MPKKQPDDEKQSAAELLSLLLRERLRRVADGTYNHANTRHLRELCSILPWKHSEASGKHQGCRFWSQGATESFQKHGRVVTDRRRYGGEALRHEHLFPRGQLTDKLFLLDGASPMEIRGLLDRLNIGVVVTVDEDERLERDGIDQDPWERYRRAGIKWIDRRAEAVDVTDAEPPNTPYLDSSVKERHVDVSSSQKSPGSGSRWRRRRR